MRIYRLLAASLVALMVSVLGSIAPQQAVAASDSSITIALTATVDEVIDPHQVLGGTIQPGGTITGTYTYNAAARNASLAPNIANYLHTTAPYGISLKAGGHVFETDPQKVNFSVYLQNNFYGQDHYAVISDSNRPLSEHVYVTWISWWLDDPTQTTLKNIALPRTAPKLSDWQQSAWGLVVDGYAANAQYPQDPFNFRVRAHVTQAQKISR